MKNLEYEKTIASLQLAIRGGSSKMAKRSSTGPVNQPSVAMLVLGQIAENHVVPVTNPREDESTQAMKVPFSIQPTCESDTSSEVA